MQEIKTKQVNQKNRIKIPLHRIWSVNRAIMRNAKDLIDEAHLLMEHSRFARAFALSLLAKEEVAKIILVTSAGAREVTGEDLEWVDFNTIFRSHVTKW